MKQLLHRSAVVLSGLLGLGLWKLVAMWALARWQGPVVQGAFSLSMAGMAFGAVFLSAGGDYANAYLVGKRSSRALASVWNAVWISVVLLPVAILWTVGFSLSFPQTVLPLGAIDKWPGLAVIAVSTALLSLQQSLQAATIGLERYDLVARSNLLSGAVWAVGALAGVHVSYLMVLCAWLLSLVGVCLYYLQQRGALLAKPLPVDWPLLREQVHYGIRTVPGGVARALNMRAALYLSSVFLTPSDVGVYGLLLTLAETLLYVPSAVSQVVLGTSASGKADVGAYRGLYAVVAVVGVVTSALAILFGGPVLGHLFSAEYAHGAPALALLVLAVTAHSVGLLQLHHLYGSGRPAAATKAQILALVLTLIFGCLFIPRWGLSGAAMATLLTYAGFSLYLLFCEHSVSEIPVSDRLL